MVEKSASTSFTEEEQDSTININGKRPAEPQDPEASKKFKTQNWYRQPSVRELTRLNEAELLYNSNLFRLQIEEILQEVKIKERTQKKFDDWFAKFLKHMDTISICEDEYDLAEGILFKDLKVKSPLPRLFTPKKCIFKFHKFENIRIVGSYSLGSPIESNLIVDVEIKVPAKVFSKNDSVNYKYHKKRAAYLACIASHLKSFSLVDEIKYFWQNGALHSPILEGKPAGKLGNYVTFRINLSCGNEAFKLHRFAPSRNNLRASWLFDLVSKENEIGPPTPHYNCSILSNLTVEANNSFLEQVFCGQDNLKSAAILLKVWLRQRDLKVSGFFIHMFVAYLVQLRRINNMMSSYQIIRNVWVAIETSKWDTEGISLYKGKESPPITQFLQHFPVVFLDVSGYYNIAYQMSKGTYEAFKRESSMAVNMLDDGNTNSFVPLFIKAVEDLEQFDHILRLKITDEFIDNVCKTAPKDKQINFGIDKLHLAIKTAYSALIEGLGDRVFIILEKVDADYRCSIKENIERSMKESGFEIKISFGFILNSDYALNSVMKGPPANFPEAEKFRAFWGEKSELRRFQDGSITEACVWPAESISQKRLITKQIVQYILDHKFGIRPENTFYIADQLDSVLIRKQVLPSDGIIGTGEELALKVVQAFDDLRRDLRGLTELPLEITSVYGTSPILSYTDPFPQICSTNIKNPRQRGQASLIKDRTRDGFSACPSYTPVYEAVIELAHSSKWPGELEAFRCLKSAFYIHISERVADQFSLLSHPYKTHVDIVKNGVVFRFRIAHSKELTLLRRRVEGGVVRHIHTDESVAYYRDFFMLPKLRGTLHGLHQRYPAYGPTACLAKRFLSSHMIDDYHFSETVLELLAAYVFIHPEPYTAPMQPLSGFVRLLRLIAETDWTTEMLLIDFNGDMKPEQKAAIEHQFSSTPASERPALYIVTSHDAAGAGAGAGGAGPGAGGAAGCVGRRALARAAALAGRARDALTNRLAKTLTHNVLGTFVPQELGYDVTIRLRPDCVPHASERVTVHAAPAPRRAALHDSSMSVVPVVDFLPVRNYLSELRSAYSEYAVFFYDTYGGENIGVLWRPEVDEIRDFQISSANATMPVKYHKEIKFVINKAAIIEDFKILGEGLIKEVIVQQE